MRIAVIGGGPGGLYFAALARQRGGLPDPAREIEVWERNAADDTFGFGVVFSDETLGGIESADPQVYAAMAAEFARWNDIDVRVTRSDGRRTEITSGGHGFAAISRLRLLTILRERCEELGVTVRHRQEAPAAADLAGRYDLVVAADGARSATRAAFADVVRPETDLRACRYIWLSTDKVFGAFTFDIRQTPYGVMQVHAYPYDATGSTVIVEMHDDVWQRAGFTDPELPIGQSDVDSIVHCERIFAELLDGHRLVGNNSRWLRFGTIRCGQWSAGNVVLLGDAAHTAHFSIGSGTKLAMEDALALAGSLSTHTDVAKALAAYEEERRPVVISTQRAAQASLEWFENLGQYLHQEPRQFAFNLLTRSRRITYDNLRLRDPGFVADVDGWFAGEQVTGERSATPRPPMFHSLRLRDLELINRVVVSPMDMYSAVDGVPNDFHLVHLGGKAMGGAGLVVTEMVCVSPDGRITPGCTGLYTDEQARAYRRIVSFVHSHSRAAIGVQLGHSGRKGSTKVMWEGMDEPLAAGNWPVVGPSALPYRPDGQVPVELSVARMAEIRDEFVAAARRADTAGFDLLELHCAHGYLLSSFLSPLTNQRDDEYGGSLANRLRYPLEVFDAIRAVWPASKPMSVRISASDWHPGGNDTPDALAIATAFAEHGVDLVDVSTGQVVSTERPAFGRSYQTPFADAIRNRVPGVRVMAVGAISSYDDVNAILLAGRADLCALGRTHLYDPQWTLHAAAEQNYHGPAAPWPAPYAAGSRLPPRSRRA
jgi:anthraniloyl-CoA monooxygenase